MSIYMHDTVAFLLARVATSMNAWSVDFKKLGLSVFGARVLVTLQLNGSATVGELVDATSIDQSTLSHILRRLGTSGLITKKRDAKDQRSVQVSLTAAGHRVAEKCLHATVGHERMVTQGMEPEEVRRLKIALQRLYQNVGERTVNGAKKRT